MRCIMHGKEKNGMCYWCGKVLCPMCITHQNGKKRFCEKCYVKVGHIKKPDRPFVKVRQRTDKKSDNISSPSLDNLQKYY